MALQTAAQFNLVPDTTQAIGGGLQNAQRIQQIQNQDRLRELEQEQLGTRQRALGVPGEVPQEETPEQARQRAIADNPEEAARLFKTIGIDSQAKLEKAARDATRIASITDPVAQDEAIKQRAREITAEGGDPKDTLELLTMNQEERQATLGGINKLALTALQRETLDFKERTAAQKAAGKGRDVQSSKILPGGLTQLVFEDGTVEVKPAKEADKLLVEQAERRGAELQGLRSGERTAAKESQKQAAAAFKGLSGVRKTIDLMEDGIREIDAGAGVGALESKFPSFKAASIRLDNIQGNLGLNVIQNTTFGSLSEAELAFALSTALPQGLNSAELRDWMVKKRDAQKKLAGYLEESAIFLGTPGNTVADFLTLKRDEQAQAAQQQAQTAQPGQAATQPQGGGVKFLGFEQ